MLLPSARSLAVAAFLGLSFSALGAEIAGGGGKAGELKPAERPTQPRRAEASDDALKSQSKFTLPAGFTSHLWAAEPLLGNAVAFDLDEKGRAFVAETFRYRTSVLDIRHYMFMLEDDLASRSTDDRIKLTKKNFPKDWQLLERETEVVRLVEDKDGDGKADFASDYAAGMNTMLDGINSGVLAHDGQVWSTNMPNLWHFSGTTPEGKAEKTESLSFGYGVRFSFTGHDMHGLILGPDGRLYFSFGDRGAHVVTKEGKTLAFPDEGAVFRCEPDGTHLEMYYKGLRNPQELGFDDRGNLFTGDNDCDQGDRERWVYLVENGDSGWRVGWQHPPLGKAHNMWLTERMWEPRNDQSPYYILSPILNIPDGPSGVAHYPGTGLPAEYADTFLVCGFKGSSAKSAISYWKVKPDGAGFAVDKSPAAFIDHVQATDVLFGPDSKVYFTEWGEGWDGVGRSRIFSLSNAEVEKTQAAQIAEVKKLLGEGFKQRPNDELGRLLGHADQRIRLNAQWALAKKSDGATTLLAAAQKGQGLARLHGIWGVGHTARLAGYQDAKAAEQALTPLVALLSDSDPEVRAQAAKTLGEAKVASAYAPLVQALKDAETRVRFFAAQSLAKYGKAEVAEPIVALLRENADRDEFIRHAGVMALLGSGNQAAIDAAAKDSSKSVRLAALLAYRRQGNPAAAQFLADTDPSLVREAARAICDGGIAAAMPELAKLLAKPVNDDKLMFRILDAAFRAGDAAALATYAADQSQPEELRREAITLLGLFAQPPARDRVAGLFRPLSPRDAQPAATALAGVLPQLVGAAPKIAIGSIEAAEALSAKATGSVLLDVIVKKQAPAEIRSAALHALANFGDAKLPEAIKVAVTDSDPSLRIAASAMLGKLDPEEAARQLAAAYASAKPAQKKQILEALGDLPGASADKAIIGFLDQLAAGQIPADAQLEAIEAAEKRTSPEVKAKLSAWQNSFPATDPLARFNFALAGGNAERGETLFKEHAVAQCLRCHKVKGSGGEAGPDLSNVGSRKDRRYILESIVNPNAQIADGFQTVMFTLKDGNIKAGIVKAETADSITVQMPVPGIPPETFQKSEVKSRDNAPSGMPPGFGDLLSKRDLRDIIEYVSRLR